MKTALIVLSTIVVMVALFNPDPEEKHGGAVPALWFVLTTAMIFGWLVFLL